MSGACQVQGVRIGFFGAARRRRGACDALRAARAARRAPRALGRRDAIFWKGIFGCAARGRFCAALFGRQRGSGARMLGARARWFWCKWRRTRGCAVVCRRSGQSRPKLRCWCVIRKFDFQPPPRTPRSEGRAAPTAQEPLKDSLGPTCGSPSIFAKPEDAGRRGRTRPDLVGRAWTPS